MLKVLSNKREILIVSAIGLGVSAYAAAKFFSSSGSLCSKNYGSHRQFHAMDDYPDLRTHNNCMATHLSPRLYSKLKDAVTPSGFTLDLAIQTGLVYTD
jgi:creatine kinase